MDLKLVVKLIRDTFRVDNIKIDKADVLTFACDNDRYIDYQGKKYSPLINTLEDALANEGLKSVSITRIASRIKGNLSHGRVYSPEGGFARALLVKRLKGIFLPKGTYPYSYLEEKIWDRILSQSEAKVVVGINPSRELCTVCHRKGIWVADIQHGVISESHPWYGEKFRSTDKREWLPDAFYCWDNSSASAIGQWANKVGIQTIAIGNPWVNRFIMCKPNDQLCSSLRTQYNLSKNGKPTILLTLSWGCYNIPNEFIHPHLEKFILDTINIYNWIIRLHPNQLQGFATDSGDRFVNYYADKFADTGIDWKLASSMPLPLLISMTDVHISWNSSVCIESAFMGVRSLLLDPELMPKGRYENHYFDLQAAGYVDKILPEYGLIQDWVKNNISVKMKPYEDHLKAYDQVIDDLITKAKR